jgi:hypothetical protein
MSKHFFIAWIAVFIVWMLGDFGVHGFWLAPAYMEHASLYRTMESQQQYMIWMILAHLVMAGGVSWIYGRGVTSAAWTGQGIRFGLALATITSSTYMIYYSIMPLPHGLVLNQLIGNTAVMLLVGLAAAFAWKGSKAE